MICLERSNEQAGRGMGQERRRAGPAERGPGSRANEGRAALTASVRCARSASLLFARMHNHTRPVRRLDGHMQGGCPQGGAAHQARSSLTTHIPHACRKPEGDGARP